jgi:saccharopine dehydrogenase (NADP+, L-glutamate forming)
MHEIVVFGAGLVAAPLVDYLLKQPGFRVTVASRTVSKAKALVGDAENGKAIEFTIDQKDKLDELVRTHDLAVSLLPYTHHVQIAERCIAHKKHLVTTSYVSDAMGELDSRARDADIILLNESGLDPGIDHMSAMKIIHDVQARGGRIASFTSFCGGLPAPDSNTNPFGYKFSWSPRGVLLAGTNSAHFRENGEDVHIDSKDLFTSNRKMVIQGLGEFEGYPNRNSIPYKDIYGIQDTETILRGTLRYPGWCATLKAIVDLDLLNQDPRPEFSGTTYRELMAHLAGTSGEGVDGEGDVNPMDSATVRTSIAAQLGIDPATPLLDNFEWLGLFSETPLPQEPANSLDHLCALMESKMQYAGGERDMIALQHNFIADMGNGTKEHITSTLIAYGIPGGYSSMARTVGLPAAIAVKMILHGEIKEPGVHIPIKPTIYEPILAELEKEGIRFEELTEAA